jgi:hypothetical protein
MNKYVEIQAAHSSALAWDKSTANGTAAPSINELIYAATQTHYSENTGFDPVAVTSLVK